MASKPKTKDFIVHHRAKTKSKGCTVLGRYLIGAKNAKEAEDILKNHIGKHCNVTVYHECKESELKHGEVVVHCITTLK